MQNKWKNRELKAKLKTKNDLPFKLKVEEIRARYDHLKKLITRLFQQRWLTQIQTYGSGPRDWLSWTNKSTTSVRLYTS